MISDSLNEIISDLEETGGVNLKREKIHPETGEVLHRDVRMIEFNFKGMKFTVNMPGWYPADNDNGIFTHEDLQVSENALTQLRAQQKQLVHATDFSTADAVLA